ncbi:MAG TPA: hypothetical protein VFO76_03610 [Candidatus Kapabacteria bacterium]|nr:hypothetical protein [Candidatus Kapabacteria bacterium]
MKPLFTLRTLALSLIVVSTALFLSGCSSPTTTSPSTTPVIQNPVDNPIHTKGKNDGRVQSVTFTVVNNNGHDVSMRVYSGVTYDDITVPSGIGTSYYSIQNHVTSVVINGQTVYGGVPTQVTLPDNTVVTESIIVVTDTMEQN